MNKLVDAQRRGRAERRAQRRLGMERIELDDEDIARIDALGDDPGVLRVAGDARPRPARGDQRARGRRTELRGDRRAPARLAGGGAQARQSRPGGRRATGWGAGDEAGLRGQARARAPGGRRAAGAAGRGGRARRAAAAARAGDGGGRRASRSRSCSPPRRCAPTTHVPAQPPTAADRQHPLVSQGGSMASAFGSVWVADIASGRLLRLDPRTRAVEARIPLGGGRVGRCRGRLGLGARRATGCCGSIRRATASWRQHRRAPRGARHDPRGRRRVWIAYPDALVRIDRGATWSRAPCRPRARVTRRSEPSRTGGSSTSRGATAGCCASTRGRARACRPSARRAAQGGRSTRSARSSAWPTAPSSSTGKTPA